MTKTNNVGKAIIEALEANEVNAAGETNEYICDLLHGLEVLYLCSRGEYVDYGMELYDLENHTIGG